jgi:hypothetical protein
VQFNLKPLSADNARATTCLTRYTDNAHKPHQPPSEWARDYIHHVQTFVGAQEVAELTMLRDQRRQLIKLIAELKAENRRLKKRLARHSEG